MSERRTRRRPRQNVSAAHYVGYVEDNESVEAIMKKFEELEKIQSEIAKSNAQKVATESETVDTNPDAVAAVSEDVVPSTNENGAEQGLTEEQLEEVFKQTSVFTVRSAITNEDIDAVDDLEIWRMDMANGDTAEFEEEDDYLAVDDDFWDEEFGVSRKRNRKTGLPGERRGRLDKESILQRYRIMHVRLQDRNGNFFMVKKKVSAIDPSLPTYVKIPAVPIPRSWVHTICEKKPIEERIPGSRYYEQNITSLNLSTLGKQFQVIYMDPPLVLPNEEPSPGKITLEQLAALEISRIVPVGFLFVWIEKEYLPDIVQIADKWGFKYVENFCWIKKNINNQIACQPSAYFRKSKLSLLIFRKEGDIELRHQRNPDCVFDFIKPLQEDEVSERKPEFIYDVIETMLPTALYSEEYPNGERMLELWAKKNTRRQGWTTVVDQSP
ncbi:hypothetical protein K493DRAFT_315148 [Basidiobolus meristosporus CBS 931.73]|uniref:MT-A70-domain-containing protein n=1 Tax=Basidiobolus meristosporus CBS 931.73 TaxID=1314790 RepID=A0A1Y1YAV1_9FUNG|nr:hypothetical protein K493DRAFT_315148 [Basidiobolus meristosporus CBS 931.73]|eukprot:ORX95161.1 hypothetical protein K493DRAFT_315148 [Basidiobolus meristosporus CBS 931.73]